LDAVEEDGELVAAEAGDGVGRADGGHQLAGDLPEHEVAGRVAEAVVHGLEVVEVDEHDADRGRPALRAHERVLDAVDEERPVGEARNRVVEGLVGELVLEGLALAHVAAVQDDAAHVLVVQEVGVLDLELEPGAVAVLERALERVRLRALRADARHDLREPWAVGLGEQIASMPRASSRTDSGKTRTDWPSKRRRSLRTWSGTSRNDVCEAARSHALPSRVSGQASSSVDAATEAAPSSPKSTSRARVSGPRSSSAAEMAAACTCSRPAEATSSAPASRSASSRETARSSWRTRPAIRKTTSRKSTAEATMTTRTSGLW